MRTDFAVSATALLTTKCVGNAWKKSLENPAFMKWTFRCTGLTLATDGSEDAQIDFQGAQKGVPDGMLIENPS